jgi:hypothetical protein
MAQVIRTGVIGNDLLRRWKRFSATLSLSILLFLPCLSSTAADPPTESQIQAAFLLNFTKFIEWPAGSLGASYASFNICVLGNNPFGSALEQVVAGEVVYGRKVVIQKIERAPEAGFCQIVFTGPQDADPKMLARLGRGVLTVGVGQAFVRNGGMIGFVLENRRVSFEINRAAAESAGLVVSSRLLAVAKAVTK